MIKKNSTIKFGLMGYVMPWAHVFRPTSQRQRISIESSIPFQLELVVIIIVAVVVAI